MASQRRREYLATESAYVPRIMTCVYDCVHPLWGGHGVCEEETRCVCDVGFTNLDSFGNPSCVPRSVLLASYTTVAVVAIGASIFLFYHAVRHTRLPLSIKTSRRAVLRQRLTLASSGYTIGCAVVFCIAASLGGNLPLWGHGICEIFFTMFYPFRAPAVSMVAALWVNSLPSQVWLLTVLPPKSFATRLKEYSETRHVFGILGVVAMVVMLGFGVVSWFDPPDAMRLADTVSAFGEALAGLCIIFVGTQTFVAIDRRQKQQPSEASRAFYGRAKRMLVIQMLALNFSTVVYLVATWVIHYTVFGRYTAVIPLVLRFLDGMLGLCTVVHFAMPDRSTEAKRGASPSSARRYTTVAEPASLASRVKHHLPKIQAPSFWGKKQAATSKNIVPIEVRPRSASAAGNVAAVSSP